MDKHNLKTVVLSLSTALLLGITGCSSDSSNDDSDSSGSGGGTPPSSSVSYSGIGIDGILMDALVCIDADEDGSCNNGEVTTRTADDGTFEFPAGSPTGPLILSGGFDKSLTDGLNPDGSTKYKAFEGVLKAPEGSSVVTPLTSAIQSLMDNNSSISAADAEATIKTAMGLTDVGVSLTEFDPYNGIEGANSEAAKKILAKQTQLQILVHTAAATIAGADASTNVDDAMANVFDALVESMDTGVEVELDAQAVAIATRQAAAETFAGNADADALVVAVGTVAEDEAEDAVTAANSAETAISSGAAEDAIDTLDNAIKDVNQEDGHSAAQAKDDQPSGADFAAIIGAREAEDAAAKEAAAKEAEAVAARKKADQALLDAQSKDELEAAERLRVEAAQAEQLAAKKAALEAEKAKLAAAQEAAIDEAKALEKADAAAAEKDAADAAALAAEIEAQAAQAAAEALKDAEEAELEALKAEAAAAALAAEQARASDLIDLYIVSANNAAATAQIKKESIQVIVTEGYDVNASLTVATQAADKAQVDATALVEYKSVTAVADLNTTTAENLKDSVLAQALIVSDALSDAQAIKTAEQLRVINLINSYIVTANDAAATAQTEKAELQVIATEGYEVDANLTVATQAAEKAQVDATALVEYKSATAVADLNTTTALNLKDSVVEQALIVSNALSDAQAIKVTKISITASQVTAQAALESAQASSVLAETSFSQAMDDADTMRNLDQEEKSIDLSTEVTAATNAAEAIFAKVEVAAAAAAEAATAQETAETTTSTTVAQAAATQAAEKATLAAQAAAEAAEAAAAVREQLLTMQAEIGIAQQIRVSQVAALAALEAAQASSALAETSYGQAVADSAAMNTLDQETSTVDFSTEVAAATNAAEAIYAKVEAAQVAASQTEAASLAADSATSVSEAQAAAVLAAEKAAETAQIAGEAAAEAALVREQLRAMQETVAGTEGRSSNVANAVDSFNTFDPTTESLTAKLAEIKDTLGTENKDELVLAAFIDIVDIVNSDAVKNLIDTNSSLPNLDAFSGDVDVMVTMASTASTLGGTELIHEMAVKLKNASDVIGNAFVDNSKVMEYGDAVIGVNDALLVRAGALSAASALEMVASYSYGDISFARVQTRTIDGEEYEYVQGEIDPIGLFGQDTFLKMDNTARLVDAGELLKSAATLYVSIDPAYILSQDLNTSGAESLLDAFNGDGLFEQSDGSAVNVNKIFSSTDYLDRDDLDIPTAYLGYSSDVLAEYNKAADHYENVSTYVAGGCSGDFPTADINWTLLSNPERNTTVTLDIDLTIKEKHPTYMESRPVFFDQYWAEHECQFYTQGDSDYGRADSEISPKESVSDVIIPVKLADKFVSGATFYTHFYNGDDTFIKVELTSESDVTATHRMYYPDENGTLVSSTYTYTGTYSVDADDQVTMSVVDTNDSDYKDTYYFTLEDAWDDGMRMKVLIDIGQDGRINDEFYNDYDFVKPDWYPADF